MGERTIGMAVHLTLLGRPRPKKNSMRIARTPSGRTFLLPSAANVSWTNDAKRQLRAQYPGPPLTVPVSVTYRFYLPDRRTADADNLQAAVNDALEGIVLADDRQIIAGVFSRSMDPANPRTELVIHAMGVDGVADTA